MSEDEVEPGVYTVYFEIKIWRWRVLWLRLKFRQRY